MIFWHEHAWAAKTDLGILHFTSLFFFGGNFVEEILEKTLGGDSIPLLGPYVFTTSFELLRRLTCLEIPYTMYYIPHTLSWFTSISRRKLDHHNHMTYLTLFGELTALVNDCPSFFKITPEI